MQTHLQVLSEDERDQIHEHTLGILARTGVRVLTATGRRILMEAGAETDAYLELRGWGIPVAVMPMPLMGATVPASQISTFVIANCEVLATLCIVQAAEPGVPFIYASISALIDLCSGLLKSSAIERGALSVATTEMPR